MFWEQAWMQQEWPVQGVATTEQMIGTARRMGGPSARPEV
jgi:hypothetical protein